MNEKIKFCVQCGSILKKWDSSRKVCPNCGLVHSQYQFPMHLIEIWELGTKEVDKDFNPSERKQ